MWYQTVLAYIKKYWGYVAVLGGVVFAGVFFRQNQVSAADKIKEIQDAHDAEIKAINDARVEEERQHAANEKQLQDTLALVQKHYDEAQKQLDEKKKAEVESLVKQYGDNPDVLAQKLSDATGFKVILPS